MLFATIFATFLLFSCAAKQAAREVVVRVPADFAGEITLDPCSMNSSAEVVADAHGVAATSACPQPGETVTVKVLRAGMSYRVLPRDVTIERAGDGLPVSIKAHVPER